MPDPSQLGAVLLPVPMTAGSALTSPNLVEPEPVTAGLGGPLVIAAVEVAAVLGPAAAGLMELEVPVHLVGPEPAGSVGLEAAE